jgi:hypothetical protein
VADLVFGPSVGRRGKTEPTGGASSRFLLSFSLIAIFLSAKTVHPDGMIPFERDFSLNLPKF